MFIKETWKRKKHMKKAMSGLHVTTRGNQGLHFDSLAPCSSLWDRFLILDGHLKFEMFHDHTFTNIHNIPFMKARIIVSS